MAAIFPVSAPFNTSTSYSGSFIPQIWSSKLNAKFYKTTVLSEIANTNWEGDIKSQGDKVVINNVPTLTISTYSAGTALNYEVPTPSTVTMNIDKGKYFAFQVNDVLAYQSQPKLMDVFTNDATMQMKIAIDSTVLFNTFSSANSSNKGATAGVNSGAYNLGTDTAPITLSAANVISTITSLSSVLDEQNVPETDRFLLIDPVTRQVLLNSNLAQAQFMGDSRSAIRTGLIGELDRFKVYVSNNLPYGAAAKLWNSGLGPYNASSNTNGEGGGAGSSEVKRRSIIAGHRCAIAFASQMTKVETLRNPSDFGDYIRGLNVYGYSVVKDTSLAYAVVA